MFLFQRIRVLQCRTISTLSKVRHQPPRLNHNIKHMQRQRKSTQNSLMNVSKNRANLLTKPLLFSSFVVTASFGTVAVADRLNWQLPPALREMNQRTPYLWPFVGTVVLANVIVFGCWSYGKHVSYITPRFIERYFLCQHGIPHSFALLGSTFSHQGAMHLGFNMFAFYGFGRACCQEIGPGDTAAMVNSFVFVWCLYCVVLSVCVLPVFLHFFFAPSLLLSIFPVSMYPLAF